MRIDKNNDSNLFEMSDEEVMSMTAPPAVAKVEKTEAELEAERAAAAQAEADAAAAAAQAEADQAAADEAARVQAEADAAAAAAAAAGGKPDGEGDALAAADGEVLDPTKQKPAAEAKPGDAKDKAPAQPAADSPEAIAAAAAEAAKNKKTVTPKEPTAEDHKAFFQQILGQPIKANGKDFQVRSPDEAVQLIQMGLNYTKKMQAMQSRLRVVTMLENNGLADEAKLNHLIDLSKGDPLAIQKLLSDSKFDPMTVDAEKAASYKPGNHQVSDAELAFNAVLDDLETSETGVQLISEVGKQWDEQSRQAVYQDPNILRVINEQKALGLYARITDEMDRMKTLGHLKGVPFLQAYRAVGDMLNERGLLKPEPQKKPEAAPAVPVETRVATPPAIVKNGDKAAAASPTKASPATVKTEQNFLDLPDDQFMKTLQGRL